jgi:hypothetical protein
MIEIALANVCAEHCFLAEAFLPGEARDLPIHLPDFQAVTNFAA